MNITWTQQQSKERPLELDKTSSQCGVYLRKDIVEQDGFFTYNEAYLTKEEYTEHKLTESITASIELKHDDAVVDSYTLQLIEEGIL